MSVRMWTRRNDNRQAADETMNDTGFRALVARKDGAGQTVALETLTDADLPEADVTVDVEYSSFNYKDGLALKGLNRILRQYPIVPGVDFAGTVARSESDRFRPGDKVVLTGWGVGEGWSGGFAERARVKADWLVKLPEGLDARQAMAVGTAGLTAMLSVMALERHGVRKGGDVLVTGAAGGVGSVAIRLLSRLGYRVTALTGRAGERRFLEGLGAAVIMDRAEYQAPGKPLQAERWHGAVDTVGGPILANVIAATAYGGTVAVCGLAGGTDLPATVFPFILRGIAVLGIESVQCPAPQRDEAWRRIAQELHPDDFAAITEEVGLGALAGRADAIIAGQYAAALSWTFAGRTRHLSAGARRREPTLDQPGGECPGGTARPRDPPLLPPVSRLAADQVVQVLEHSQVHQDHGFRQRGNMPRVGRRHTECVLAFALQKGVLDAEQLGMTLDLPSEVGLIEIGAGRTLEAFQSRRVLVVELYGRWALRTRQHLSDRGLLRDFEGGKLLDFRVGGLLGG